MSAQAASAEPSLPAPDASARRFVDIRRLVAADMAAVDAVIRDELRSDVLLINQIGEHIINAGGKRLRPLLVLLAARCGAVPDVRAAVRLAAIIEFIHTATLLHDDVVDQSGLRRGRQTANALWGNAASVLVGDFLYSRAFQMMVGLDQRLVMQVLADTTNQIAEGEVLQLAHAGDPDLDEARYFEVVRRKTAVLFAAGCQLGGMAGGLDARAQQSLHDYGLALGIAFQLADDVLDYAGDAARIGKHLGDDLAEGKPTLPVIIALRRARPAQVEAIRQAVRAGDREALPAVVAAIRETGALAACMDLARRYAEEAIRHLSTLPRTPCCAALAELARYAVDRSV